MNKKLPLSLFLLQTLTLLGADYTAEDVQKLFDQAQTLKFNLPKNLPQKAVFKSSKLKCDKCGKWMMLKDDISLAESLVDYINQKSPVKFQKFALDKSKLCPHCGDGMMYLCVQFEETALGPAQSYRIPVTCEDLLLLTAIWTNDPEMLRNRDQVNKIFFFKHLFSLEKTSFDVKSEAEFNASVKKWTDGKRAGVAEHYAKGMAAKKATADAYQKLMESATVLRKKDLNGFLEKLHQDKLESSDSLILTRMAIFPDNDLRTRLPLTCPKCKETFFVVNGANAPVIAPLGDLKKAMEHFDIVPDFSSLCPKCHPDASPRLLDVVFKISGREYPSKLSPKDLATLGYFFQNTMLTQGDISRLQQILQGTPDTSHIIAIPAPEK